MAPWTKSADWLPVTNALAQVLFWKKDLHQAEKFMDMLETMKVDKDNQMYKVGAADVLVSQKGLDRAKTKLKETIKRVNK